jgi:cold shock CspA family protein
MKAQQIAQPSPTARLTGTLVRVHEKGYGFIDAGEGEPDHFLLRSTVPPAYWKVGQVFEFDSGPPQNGGKNPVATNARALPAVHRRAYRG